MPDKGVRARGLSKTYSGRAGEPVLVLDDLTLDIAGGSFVSIVGPSGCGKSTFLKIVAGLVPYEEGDIFRGPDRVKGPGSNVGVVFQAPELVPWRSALNNVLLAAELSGLKKRDYVARARELLNLVGLEQFADRPPAELSGGMQQRNAIARALLLNPEFLLMDEPFGALDALTRDHMAIELQRIWAATSATVLFVTHSIPEAVLLSDRVVVMSHRPARILDVVDVNLSRPRLDDLYADPTFGDLCNRIRGQLGDATDESTAMAGGAVA
jgi:NitT/TauT family transport system ATP-binding protein